MIEHEALSAEEELEEGSAELQLHEDMSLLLKGIPLRVAKVEEDMVRFEKSSGFIFAMGINKVKKHFRDGEIDIAA